MGDWQKWRLPFWPLEIKNDPVPRRYGGPWLVLDSARAAAEWNWRPATKLEGILDEIASHAERHPEWRDLSNGT